MLIGMGLYSRNLQISKTTTTECILRIWPQNCMHEHENIYPRIVVTLHGFRLFSNITDPFLAFFVLVCGCAMSKSNCETFRRWWSKSKALQPHLRSSMGLNSRWAMTSLLSLSKFHICSYNSMSLCTRGTNTVPGVQIWPCNNLISLSRTRPGSVIQSLRQRERVAIMLTFARGTQELSYSFNTMQFLILFHYYLKNIYPRQPNSVSISNSLTIHE
jgi:hypothetical protein